MGQFLDIDMLLQRFSVGRSTFHRWRKTKGFPPPLQIGGVKRWKEEDVVAWIDAQAKKETPEAA